MICVNELSQQKCHNWDILRTLVILMAPFAPHIAEELWHALGEANSVCDAEWPEWKEEYLTEDSMKLSISFNGKTRFTLDFPADADNASIEKTVLNDEQTQKVHGRQANRQGHYRTEAHRKYSIKIVSNLLETTCFSSSLLYRNLCIQ